MSTTWIIILSIFGLLILLITIRSFFFFLNKNKPKKVETETVEEINPYLYLEALIQINFELNKETQLDYKKEKEKLNQLIIDFSKSPKYLFAEHDLEFITIIYPLVEQLINEKSLNWKIKRNEEVFKKLDYKIFELTSKSAIKQNELFKIKEKLKDELSNGN